MKKIIAWLDDVLPLWRLFFFGLSKKKPARRMSVTKFDERGQPIEFTYWEGDE